MKTIMKRSSWDDEYVVLNVYASILWVLVSGMLAGVLLAFIFASCLFPIMHSFIPLQQMQLTFFVSFILTLALSGAISSLFIVRRLRENWDNGESFNSDESCSLIIFFTGIVILCFCCLTIMLVNGIRMEPYLWAFPFIIAMTWSRFIVHMWRVLHARVLHYFFPTDPTYLVNEKRFKDQLQLKILELKRYGGDFAVLAFSLDQKNSILAKQGRKYLNKVYLDIIHLLQMSTRETDVYGQIEDGSIIISLLHTDRYGAEVISRRIARCIHEYFCFKCKDMEVLSLSVGVGLYGDNFSTVEDLTTAAIDAVNRAIAKGGKKMVYNDGTFFEKEIKYEEPFIS